jgi:putative MATE family efflux protein
MTSQETHSHLEDPKTDDEIIHSLKDIKADDEAFIQSPPMNSSKEPPASNTAAPLNFDEHAGSMTEGVASLLGNPKKALIRVSIPVSVSIIIQAIYSIVDTFWVAGLGEEALGAIGLCFPYFMGLTAISTGIGVGAGSAISRSIGIKDKFKADQFATHAMIFAVLIGFLSWVFIPMTKYIFLFMGADASLAAASASYLNVYLIFAFLVFILNISVSILNSEGNSRRTMVAMLAGGVLNIILDPLFIYDYGLGLGVKGAAYASVCGFLVSTVIVLYWLFIEKKTYVSIHLKNFKFKWSVIKEILSVGVPAAVSQLTMSISGILLTSIVLFVGGQTGAAIYTTGWRLIAIGFMPMLGLSVGLTTLAGVSYGSRDIQKLKTSYYFAIRIGTVFEIFTAAIFFIFAAPITALFATGNSAHLHPELVIFLRYICIVLIVIPINILTISMFQGVKLGNHSLILTLLRTLVFEVPAAYLLGIYFGKGLIGIWTGIIIADLMVTVVSFILGYHTIQKFKKLYPKPIDLSEPLPVSS